MAAVLPAAKEKSLQPSAGLLAWLTEKPHPGLQPNEPKLHQVDHTLKFHIALGFPVCVYDFCVGPLSTGYFRDSATGLDYADQRYEQPGMGRFMTPDSAPSANASDPGSWNRYAYVGGDPINKIDPDGKIPFCVGRGFLSEDDDVPFSGCGGGSGPFVWAMLGPIIEGPTPQEIREMNAPINDALQDLSGVLSAQSIVNHWAANGVEMSESVYYSLLQVGTIPLPDPSVILEDGRIVLGGLVGLDTLDKIRDWWEGRKTLSTWTTNCYIHVVGTPNHAATEQKPWFVQAPDGATAEKLMRGMNDRYVQAKYGSRGIRAHTQHCDRARQVEVAF
jgi:RHS repeat-associated protein